MIQPDQRTEVAIKSLRNNPDFKMVVDWLVDNKVDVEKVNRIQKDDVLVRWGQGTAQALEFIITNLVSR